MASLADPAGLARESINVLAFATELDFHGLLLAAAIVGNVGRLDDITVTQVSAVAKLRRANPALGLCDL